MRTLDVAIGTPWAMEGAALANLFTIAARENDITPEALEAYRAKSLEKAERAKVRDGVAILNVEGPLFKGANLMTEFCGATSYGMLRRDLQTALDNGGVHSILLNIDSPGGEARGTNELATAIREARGVKPIVAYAGDLAASAAYWIASAADKIVIGESAEIGSIGVYAAFEDTRKLKEARGIRTHEFVSSQSPLKRSDPDTKDGREAIQTRVDALAEIFVGAVAANRDASRAFVLERFGKGGMLLGQAAVDARMADEIGTFEATLKSLIKDRGSFKSDGAFAAHSGLSLPAMEQSAMTEIEKQAAEAKAAEDALVAAILNAGRNSTTGDTQIESATSRILSAEVVTCLNPVYTK